MGTSLELIRRYLHVLGDPFWMDGYLAECAMFRRMLLKCSDIESERQPDCAKVSVRGKEMFLRPDLDAPRDNFTAKSKRFPGQEFTKLLEFEKLPSFTLEEVFRAMTWENAGEGSLDSVMFSKLGEHGAGAIGWNTKDKYMTSHAQPSRRSLKRCDAGKDGPEY